MVPTTTSTGTVQNGGVNDHNKKLKYSKLINGNTTEKIQANNLMSGTAPTEPGTVGVTSVSKPKYLTLGAEKEGKRQNQINYLTGLVEKGTADGNKGLVQWAQSEMNKWKEPADLGKQIAQRQPLNYDMPNSYKQLANPDQLRNNANNYAENKFNNERLGYEQNIQRYQQLIDQLRSDGAIESEADRMARLKYADALLSLEEGRRDAQLRAELSERDARNNYDTSVENLNELALQQRGNSRLDLAGRGLYNSSILDQMNSMINTSQMEGQAELEKGLNEQMYRIDAELSNLISDYDARKGSLTQRQQEEMVARIDDLTRERDAKRDQYTMLIDQQHQNVNQARNNISTDAARLYQDMFNQNQNVYDRRDQFNREMALQQAKLAASRAAAAAAQKRWEDEQAQKQKELDAINTLNDFERDKLLATQGSIESHDDLQKEVIRGMGEFKLSPQEAKQYEDVLTGIHGEKLLEMNEAADAAAAQQYYQEQKKTEKQKVKDNWNKNYWNSYSNWATGYGG